MHRPPDRLRWGLPVLLACALACTSDEWPVDDDDDDDGASEDTATVEPRPQGVRLEVFEPASPSIHYIGEPLPLLAEIRDAEDLPFPYDEIVWRADGDGPTLAVGPEAEVELPPGAYDITATARLDGGDLLAATVGGVRVQSRWTGNYEGEVTMTLSAMFQGIPVSPQCTGPLSMRVDYDGDGVEVTGGSCTINAVIITFDATYEIEGSFANGVGSGTIDYALGGLFNLSFDWTGGFVDDMFIGTFAGDVTLPLIGDITVTGRFDAPLGSPWLEEPT